MKPVFKRTVRIIRQGDSWAVVYVERKPRQRYQAAQFHENYTLEQVEQWVRSNAKLELTRLM